MKIYLVLLAAIIITLVSAQRVTPRTDKDCPSGQFLNTSTSKCVTIPSGCNITLPDNMTISSPLNYNSNLQKSGYQENGKIILPSNFQEVCQ